MPRFFVVLDVIAVVLSFGDGWYYPFPNILWSAPEQKKTYEQTTETPVISDAIMPSL